ncbi:hypothetical protein Barb4_03312 [Bacteroidales bacterium Barb4]|nr:hypothetical protein Barb4_03312 [Bacteroidales bacterium Barb4]
MPDKELALRPIQRHIRLTDTEHRRAGSDTAEVRLHLRRRAGSAYIRALHVKPQTRGKGIETPVGHGVQILPVGIQGFGHGIEIEITVHRCHIRPAVIKQIAAHKPVEGIGKILLLGRRGSKRKEAYEQECNTFHIRFISI